MKSAIYNYIDNQLVPHPKNAEIKHDKVNLVLCFGAKNLLSTSNIYQQLKSVFNHAEIAICSTAGEIFHDSVQDDSIIITAIELEKSEIKTASLNVNNYSNSHETAKELAQLLPVDNLKYILVLSDGSLVNGSELIKGFNEHVSKKVLITGGLAGDSDKFESTLVGLNNTPAEGNIIAIGFYGENLVVTHGSQGGWDIFGPERIVTKSAGNIVYEIDNKNALELYKKYLGPDAEHLPGSALLFPLSVVVEGSTQQLVRTILHIDNNNNSMVFAGDIPQGSKVRFMKANFDKLTNAAFNAAHHTLQVFNEQPKLAILVSCIGRKLILGPRIDEEVEAVNELYNDNTLLTGFYSYGEISPFNEGGDCQLHNQTMTITTLHEL